MKVIIKIIGLIPVKKLAKYLPEVLAYLLTKVLTWSLTKHPEKTEKIKETVSDITEFMSAAVKATDDGDITKNELLALKKKALEIFE